MIGFLGGFEAWNDDHRSVRRLALKLGQMPGVSPVTIGNHNRHVALELIRAAFDPQDRVRARIILYGQSWGAAAAVDTARDLKRLGIPVLLTVQVDSVGRHDQVIPSNVLAAVNFYQHDPFTIQGRTEIRAADPAKTRIIGNFFKTYITHPQDNPESTSWVRRNFGGSHAKMEQDPVVWAQVEQYINDAIARR